MGYMIMSTKCFVFDIETSIASGIHYGSRNVNNDIYTLIYGSSDEDIKVEHNIKGFNRQLSYGARELIMSSDVIIGHNLSFDLGYIWETDELKSFLIRGGFTWDTQLAEYLLSGQRHNMSSLAELELIYLGEKIKENRISRLFKKKIGADKIINSKRKCPRVFSMFDKYCYNDGKSTYKVFKKQYIRAKKLGMINVIKLFNRYLLSIIMIENTGLTIDLNLCENVLREFKTNSMTYLEEASKIIKPLWNKKLGEFNINSPKHKSSILFGGDFVVKERELVGKYKNGKDKYKLVDKKICVKGFGLPKSLTSKSEIEGRFKTGKDIIIKISESNVNETAKKYCELQKLAMNYMKMCSTYLEPFLNLSINGVIYPEYKNTFTSTGRLSSSRPNVQNIPSKGGMGKSIQSILTSPAGWKCVSADYSQLEIYVLAFLSKDPALLSDLLSGVDFHVKRLAYAEDMQYDDVYKLCKIDRVPEWELKRSNAKTISYQKAYGASPNSLSKSTGLSEDIIKKIFEKEDLEYSGVSTFHSNVENIVKQNKFLSLEKNIPSFKKGNGKHSKRFKNGIELLPIIKEDGEIVFRGDQYRNIGIYIAPTGKRYAFEEWGKIRRGRLLTGFKPTQIKNYHTQGTAAVIQGCSSAALLNILLKNPDKIKMINEVHDSKWFLIREECLDRAISVIKNVMEDIPKHFKEYLDTKIDFKIPVDFKIGDNFGEMTDYKYKLGEK